MKVVDLPVAVAVALSVSWPFSLNAAELKPETVKAWQEHVRRADAHMDERSRDGQVFLWADEVPERLRRIRAGEILASPVVENGARSVPNGLIHDWIGAAFIPNTTLAPVLKVVRDYDRYKEFYRPVVVDSRSLTRSLSECHFSMIWVRRVLFVTAAVDSRYEVHDFRLDPMRSYEIVGTTQIQEITAYGTSRESRLPPDQGDGYIWRLHSIARYYERDGGVSIELEAVVLSRDVPATLAWLFETNHYANVQRTPSWRRCVRLVAPSGNDDQFREKSRLYPRRRMNPAPRGRSR